MRSSASPTACPPSRSRGRRWPASLLSSTISATCLTSGSVLSTVAVDVAGYETSKGALRFAIDEPLPLHLVEKLVTARMRELGLEPSRGA